MSYYAIHFEDSLAHHGILGQKWGVRRWQNEDGTYNEAGKRRYFGDVESAKKKYKESKLEVKKAFAEYDKSHSAKNYSKLNQARINRTHAKEDVETEKIKNKIGSKKKDSKHIQKLEKEYLSKGFTQEEAKIAAYKRAKTEKILAATIGLSIGAVGVYVAKKEYDKRVDKIIPKGTLVQNISTNSNKGVQHAFYASMNKFDNVKYRGILGDSFAYNRGLFGQKVLSGKNVYETKMKTTDDIKIASPKSALKVLKDLTSSDKQFTQDLIDHLNTVKVKRLPNAKQNEVIRKGLENLKAGKIDNSVYEALNLSMVYHGYKSADSTNSRFTDALKKAGYDSIKDLNDSKYSGYRTKSPLIMFNENKVSVDSSRQVSIKEIEKNFKLGYAIINSQAYAPAIAEGAAFASIYYSGKKLQNAKTESDIVSEYRKQHPNSELSSTEIIRTYKK